MDRAIDRRRLLIGAASALAALVLGNPAAFGRITVLHARGRRYAFLKPPAHADCAAIVRESTMRARCARHGVEFVRYA